MKNLLNRMREGFTLIEILIVVVIIGILATVAIPAYFRYVERGYAADAKTQIKSIYTAADLHKLRSGTYPENIEEIVDLDLKPSVLLKWTFQINLNDDGETGTITATSLEEMDGGADHEVIYTIETGVYSGYGQSDDGETDDDN